MDVERRDAPAYESDDSREQRAERRGVWLAVGGLTVLLGGMYVTAHVVMHDRMPVDARVAGVDLGGMSTTEASAKLRRQLAPRTDDPVVLIAGSKRYEVKARSAGLRFDLDRTIKAAGGGSTWNPVTMVRSLTGTGSTAPVLDVERPALENTVAAIADSLDRPAVEARITYVAGRPQLRRPSAGRVVDRPATERLVADSYLVARAPVRVPFADIDPAVDAEQAQTVAGTQAKVAVSGPVVLSVGTRRVPLATSVFAPALAFVVRDGQLVPSVDARKLEAPLRTATRSIGSTAQDATVRLVGERPVVVPARIGVALSAADVAREIVPVLGATGAARAITIDAQRTQPKVSTADAQALQIREKVSSFTTHYPHADYRNVNQGRAARLINGTVLRPGETFGFNDAVGERTRANGFTDGFVINGGVFREDLGGGVSQVATTTYNAAFFAGLKNVTHKPHSFYISRYPVGREATVAWPSVDLKFTNDTEYGVLIHAWIVPSAPGRQGSMHVDIWSTKTWDIKAGISAKRNLRPPGIRYDTSAKCVEQKGIAGFDVDVYRMFIRDGQQVRKETIPARYAAADTVRCGPAPVPTAAAP